MTRRLRAVLLGALLAACGAADAETVSVQLNWKHQFQFAGFYAAIEQGYYRDAGFEVQLREAQEGKDPIDAVVSGAADYGVGASELALRRAKGEPVVALATILQHSPLVLLARRGVADTVQGLAGRRVMIMPHETELYAYLQREGMKLGDIKAVAHSFDPKDLIAGKVDAVSGYLTDEPFILRKAGFAYAALNPRTSGVDFYADTLFTTEARVRRDRERVKAFLSATLKGWQYAMDHPEATADLILKGYSKRHTREHLLFEAAEMKRLMQPELIPIGYMNPGRWKHIAEVYAELGMLPPLHNLEGFLFDAEPQRDLVWTYRALAATAAALLLVGVVMLRERRRNRALYGEVARRSEAEARLRSVNEEMSTQLERIRGLQRQLEMQAMHDSLTGLYNRRFLDDALERELARARREQRAVSIVMLDIDRFKDLNDSHGHQAGDAVLRSLAQLLSAQVRSTDVACRWGGEEFVLVLPNMPAEMAVQRAEAWRTAFQQAHTPFGGKEIRATVSAGVATFPDHARTQEALLAAADAALYRAKSGGRNRVEVAAPGATALS